MVLANVGPMDLKLTIDIMVLPFFCGMEKYLAHPFSARK
jgi:hypothetical protein